MTMTFDELDLTACDREPIHLPGSIQPHGIMLVAGANSLRVHQGAGEIEQILGVADWQDQPLTALLGDGLATAIAARATSAIPGGFIGQFAAPSGQKFDVTAHLAPSYIGASHIIVELEAASTESLPLSAVIDRLTTVAADFEQAPFSRLFSSHERKRSAAFHRSAILGRSA